MSSNKSILMLVATLFSSAVFGGSKELVFQHREDTSESAAYSIPDAEPKREKPSKLEQKPEQKEMIEMVQAQEEVEKKVEEVKATTGFCCGFWGNKANLANAADNKESKEPVAPAADQPVNSNTEEVKDKSKLEMIQEDAIPDPVVTTNSDENPEAPKVNSEADAAAGKPEEENKEENKEEYKEELNQASTEEAHDKPVVEETHENQVATE